jgi:DNA-binding transcriptional MerR regulator
MVKLHVRQREEVKSIILICRARGFNPKQTQQYVNQHLADNNINKTLSESYVHRTIEQTRHEANEWLRTMSVGKHDYIDKFKTIIDRLETSQKELWTLIDKKQESNDRNKEYVCIKAYSEIHSINKTLWDLFKDLPLLMPGASSKTIDNIVFEDTTGVYPEIST